MKLKRFVYASDNHGNLVDKEAAEACFEFTNYFKPHFRIHGGDLRDNACLRGGASEDEQQQPLDEDWDLGEWFASKFFGKGCQNVLLQGNHDFPRIERLLKAEGNTLRARGSRELGNRLVDEHDSLMKRLNVLDLPYDARFGVFEMGPLRAIHGIHHNEYAAKKHAEIYGNVIHGHIHRPQIHRPRSYDGSYGQAAGCLCDLDPPYMMKISSKLAWGHGFLYGFVDINGRGPDDFLVYEGAKIGNKWIFPTEIK